MTRRLAINKKQAITLLRAAQAQRGIIEVDADIGTVRFIPECHALATLGARQSNSPGGDDFTISFGPCTAPSRQRALSDSYRRAGFDPQTISEEKRKAFEAKSNAEWEAELVRSDLNTREENVLRFLAGRGGERFPIKGVPYAGPETAERLMLRGFAAVTYQRKYPDRIDEIWATKEGVAAWRSRVDVTQSRGPYL
jgi:hypothetical protein